MRVLAHRAPRASSGSSARPSSSSACVRSHLSERQSKFLSAAKRILPSMPRMNGSGASSSQARGQTFSRLRLSWPTTMMLFGLLDETALLPVMRLPVPVAHVSSDGMILRNRGSTSE